MWWSATTSHHVLHGAHEGSANTVLVIRFRVAKVRQLIHHLQHSTDRHTRKREQLDEPH